MCTYQFGRPPTLRHTVQPCAALPTYGEKEPGCAYSTVQYFVIDRVCLFFFLFQRKRTAPWVPGPPRPVSQSGISLGNLLELELNVELELL